MPAPWQMIPNSALDAEKKLNEATAWASQQRSMLAEQWAANWRAQVQPTIDRIAEMVRPPEPLRTALPDRAQTNVEASTGPLAARDTLQSAGAVNPPAGPGNTPLAGQNPPTERPQPWQVADRNSATAYAMSQRPNPGGIAEPLGQIVTGAVAEGQRQRGLAQSATLKRMAGAGALTPSGQARFGVTSTELTPEERGAELNQALNVGGMAGTLRNVGAKAAAKAAEPLASAAKQEASRLVLPGQEARPAVQEIVGPRGEVLSRVGREAPPIEPPRPPTSGVTPPTGSQPSADFAGNIRLPKYVQPEVQDEIRRVWAADPERAEAARRQVIPDDQVRQMAQEMGVSDVEKFVRNWKPGKTGNSETLLALRDTLSAKTQSVMDARSTLRQSDTTENLLRFQLALKEQQAIQEVVHGTTAEAGRALRQFRQTVDGALASGDQNQMRKLLEKLGGREWTEEMAQRLSQIDESNPVAVYKFLRDAVKPGAKDYLLEVWYNSLLSGPRTHITNFVTNGLSAVLGPVERAGAAAIDAPLARLGGRQRERFFSEAPADLFGMVQGIPEGVRGALQVMKNGFSMEEAVRMDIRHTQAFRGPLGAAVNVPSRALAAADVFWKGVLYRGALNAGAYRAASREGLKGKALATRVAELIEDPTPQLLEEAGKISKYRIFQQEPGPNISGLMALRNRDVLGIPVMRMLVPFLQTPVNIMKFGLERSPLGMLNPKMYAHIAKGNSEASDELARALMGSTVAAGIGSLVATGQIDITGQAPTNAAARDRWNREGKQPFSVRVGDRWYSYQKMEPLNQTLAQVAATVDAVRNGDDQTAMEIGGQAGQTILANLFSQTYMSSLSEFFDAVGNPNQSGGLARWGQSQAAGFVPFSSLSRTAAQAIDPTVRTPKTIGEQILANTPGLTQNVPPKLTAFGEQRKRESPWWSPVTTAPAHQSRRDRELERLGLEVGYAGKSVQGRALTDSQQRYYQRLVGASVKTEVDELLRDGSYWSASKADQYKRMQSAIRRGRDAAADQMVQRLPRTGGLR